VDSLVPFCDNVVQRVSAGQRHRVAGALEYDEDQGGYVIDINKEFLENAPRYSANEAPRFTPEYGSEIDTAYGVEYEDA
jgi:hypothetical protein